MGSPIQSSVVRRFALAFAVGMLATGAHAADICGDNAFYGMDDYDADCHALKLVSASGVPQDKQHSYQFSGTCNVVFNCNSGPKVLKTVPALAQAKWDGTTMEFEETFKVLAPFQGSDWKITTGAVKTIFKCNDDPLITSAACGSIQHSNQSGYPAFSNPALKQSRPLVKGKTNLAEAEAKSKQSAASGAGGGMPPPPAPRPQPKRATPVLKAGAPGSAHGVAVPTPPVAPGTGRTSSTNAAARALNPQPEPPKPAATRVPATNPTAVQPNPSPPDPTLDTRTPSRGE